MAFIFGAAALAVVALAALGWLAGRGRAAGEAERRALWQCIVECPLHAADDREPPCADLSCPWRVDVTGGGDGD